jgi:hypothetical protein
VFLPYVALVSEGGKRKTEKPMSAKVLAFDPNRKETQPCKSVLGRHPDFIPHVKRKVL